MFKDENARLRKQVATLEADLKRVRGERDMLRLKLLREKSIRRDQTEHVPTPPEGTAKLVR